MTHLLPLVQASGVRKTYHGEEALKGINLEIFPGEVVAILGPSGSGKSTFLRSLALLEPIDSGEIRLRGRPIGQHERRGTRRPAPERVLARHRRPIGMVFQNFNLFAHRTVLANLTLAQRVVKHLSRRDAEERGRELLARVGLAGFESKYPSELSGGQQQRVAIARALVLEPEVVLFDEPTSALDPELVREVLTVMESLAAQGMTMIVVTHEIAFARSVATRVVMFDSGEIVADEDPDAYFEGDQHPRVAAFLKHVM